MSNQYPILNNISIDKWKVKELKEELKRRELKSSGLKVELIARLNAAIGKEKQTDHEEELGQEEVQQPPVVNSVVIVNEISNATTVKVNKSTTLDLDLNVASLCENSGDKGNSTNGYEGVITQSEPRNKNADKQESDLIPNSEAPIDSVAVTGTNRLNNKSDDFHSEPEAGNSTTIGGGSPVKLNLYGSTDDDMMEGDELEIENVEGKTTENLPVERDGIVDAGKTDLVHVMEKGALVADTVRGLSAGKEAAVIEEETRSEAPAKKRKLEDNEVSGRMLKQIRQWSPDSINVPDLQTPIFRSNIARGDFQPSGKCDSNLVVSTKKRSVPPSRKPATSSLRIDRFVRPFTLEQVQSLLSETGTISSFWMDDIKTHCYVTYSSVEEAIETRNAIYDLKWPQKGKSRLAVEFVDPQDVQTRCESPPQSMAPIRISSSLSRKRSIKDRIFPPLPPLPKKRNAHHEPEEVGDAEETARDSNGAALSALEKFFKGTKAKPVIYYLPLSEEKVQAKRAAEKGKERETSGEVQFL